jgi:hypothetical protein
MAVRARVTAFEKSVKFVVDGSLSREAAQKRIAVMAREEIAEGDEINRRALGSVPPRTITVDGRNGAPLESVNPHRGTIIVEWSLIGDVLQWIFATLRARSPRVSGAYLKGHKLYADGRESDPTRPPLAKEYVFQNLVPYARKIEIGKTKSGRNFVIQVENKIYLRTADDAKAKFGNVAKIRHVYQAARDGNSDRVPTIVVTLT